MSSVNTISHGEDDGGGRDRRSDTFAAFVRLLDADPELARGLAPDAAAAARRAVIAPRRVLEPGATWVSEPGDQAMLGCLVLEGALVARTHLLENARATELLGPGDVIWPWMQNPGDATFSTAVDWSILVESEVAILGPLFMRRAAPWPQIFSALMTRLALRARGLDVLLALRQVRGIEHRILVLLWSLADRFGKVTAEGVRLEVPLTHQLLADLVGARRPTVTTALSQLRTRALLRVLPGERGWVLTGLPPLEALATGGLRTPLRAGA